MAKYAIGDIQGCFDEFSSLLNKISFNPSVDHLYIVGDLVNRGPKSLQVLEYIYNYQDSISIVLGNHDIYLIGRYANVLYKAKEDTLDNLLLSTKASKLIDYLRRSPLIIKTDKYIFVHAGVYPKINFDTLLTLSFDVNSLLMSTVYMDFIKSIYGSQPNYFNEELLEHRKLKFVINSCTRMRFINKKNFSLNLKYKGEISKSNDSLIPWFEITPDSNINQKIVFGHWASLGYFKNNRCIAIDTGCVWGKKLTALDLDTEEIIQV